MAIIYCDRDGVPMMVTGFMGGDGHVAPPPGEAFSVYVPDDIGQKIAKQPKMWRFPGVDTFEDRARMRYIGGKGASESTVANWKKQCNDFADRVSVKREAAEKQRAANLAADEVGVMMHHAIRREGKRISAEELNAPVAPKASAKRRKK